MKYILPILILYIFISFTIAGVILQKNKKIYGIRISSMKAKVYGIILIILGVILSLFSLVIYLSILD